MPQITVGTAPTPIPNNGTDQLYGINVGSTVLWYSKLPSVSVASGTPLAPGNAIQGWPAGQPLFIVSTGGNGQFAYEANGSQIAIGAVAANLLPGASVEVSNTVGVTGTVDASGSTVGISGTVPVTGPTGGNVPISGSVTASGTVAVSGVGGTVTTDGSGHTQPVNGTVGAVPQNLPTVLGTSSTAFTTAAASQTALTAVANAVINKYGSVIVNVLDNQSLASPLVNQWIDITITQLQVGVVVQTYEAQWLLGHANGTLQIPVVGDTIRFAGSYSKAAGASGGTITVQLIGSSEIIGSPLYISANSPFAGGLGSGGAWSVDTAVAVTTVIESKNGPAVLSALAANSTANGSANVQYIESGAGVILTGTGAIGAGGHSVSDLILPMRPIQVAANPNVSGQDIIVSLMQ